MKNLLRVLISLMLLAPAVSFAEVSPGDSKAIDDKVAAFFGAVQKGDSQGAFDGFMSPSMSEQQQAMRNLVATTNQVTSYFDGPFTYEKISESELGSHLVYRKYLMLSDKAPFLVTATMYKTSKGWVCQALFMRDVTQDDF